MNESFIEKAIEDGEKALANGIAAASAEAGKPILYTGKCLYCEEPVEEPRRFCDAQCRDDFDAEQKLKANQGKR